MSPVTNRQPSGTASACPVDRSSTPTTSWPASVSRAAHTLPAYPAPPVTSNRTLFLAFVDISYRFQSARPAATAQHGSSSDVPAGTRRRDRGEQPRGGPGPSTELLGHGPLHLGQVRRGHQRDGRTAEPGTGHPGAQRTGGQGRVHRDVQ